MNLKIAAVAAALLATVGTAPSAYAGYIDFTDDLWRTQQSGDSASSRTRTIGGIGNVTLQAFTSASTPGTLTFQGGVPGTPATPCGILACDNDGVGINDDEISFGTGNKQDVERLVVTFETAIDLAHFHFLDLFGAGATSDDPESERVQWQINGNGPGGVFDGTAMDEVGYAVTGELGYKDVFQIEFFADTARRSSPANTDFALAAIQTTVPSPATLLLFAGGLIALGAGTRLRAHAEI
ncbi:hypothetical protein [Rhodovibrio salinarum]|uniref:PEP-CTERM protein-sorting domain-containing protein n=1 Tax=Rhodovibrio salinarum TaxID=1087 RepID=A0A934QLX3_9PROT|nr:hypothetical protein [Rhodovibrio salinarum]MBK1699261.1 hypothetical protein [Rhodovibrio salinarum]